MHAPPMPSPWRNDDGYTHTTTRWAAVATTATSHPLELSDPFSAASVHMRPLWAVFVVIRFTIAGVYSRATKGFETRG
jgi:hypothetical protein